MSQWKMTNRVSSVQNSWDRAWNVEKYFIWLLKFYTVQPCIFGQNYPLSPTQYNRSFYGSTVITALLPKESNGAKHVKTAVYGPLFFVREDWGGHSLLSHHFKVKHFQLLSWKNSSLCCVKLSRIQHRTLETWKPLCVRQDNLPNVAQTDDTSCLPKNQRRLSLSSKNSHIEKIFDTHTWWRDVRSFHPLMRIHIWEEAC